MDCTKRSACGIGIGLVLLASGLLFFWYQNSHSHEQKDICTQCVVTSRTPIETSCPDSGYKRRNTGCYTVVVQLTYLTTYTWKFQTNVVGYSPEDALDANNALYPIGKSINCWYNPDNPAEVTLFIPSSMGLLGSAIAFLGVGICGVIAWAVIEKKYISSRYESIPM